MNEAKFKVGDTVVVNHPTCGTWQGKVLSVNNVGDYNEPDWEYRVSNAPMLAFSKMWPTRAWEEEMTIAS